MPSVFSKPNRFNRSHVNLLTCDMGKLVPFFVEEVIPGDEFRVKTDAIIRLAPMLAPIFGEVDFYTHYFFVPNRLAWKNWEDFITNGLENGVTQAVHPYIVGGTGDNWSVGSLADYMGIPVLDNAGPDGSSVVSPNGIRFNALPFRAYAKIYNDWYRSEFLQDEIPLSLEDGEDTTTNLVLQSRNWPRDYFTSALPFTQLGQPAVLPVFGAKYANVEPRSTEEAFTVQATFGLTPSVLCAQKLTNTFGQKGVTLTVNDLTANASSGFTWDDPNLRVNLEALSVLDVNNVRMAFQLQRIMERKARSGNRYVEYLASSFGVRSPDARLQRAEFLGGGKSPVMISEVLQTSEGTASSPQGNMAGHGFGAARTHAFNKAFVEHGFIIGILSIMPKTLYGQGRERMFARETWSDYYQPEFAHLGEQPVYNKELVANSNDEVFGYQPRYEEYRRKLGRYHGDYRTNLNYWHFGREFGSTNVPLNGEFLKSNPAKSRIFAAGEQADRPCWIEMFLDVQAIRPMPKHGNPGMIDH